MKTSRDLEIQLLLDVSGSMLGRNSDGSRVIDLHVQTAQYQYELGIS